MRAAQRLPSFRADLPFGVIRSAMRDARGGPVRIVHFSIQRDHIHLLVEAANARALSSGMRGLAIRIARRLNRALGRRGAVWGDRWHGRALRSPRAVRNALAYVLFNGHKHGVVPLGLDPCASIFWSACAFADVAYHALADHPAARDPPVSPARAWLLSTGWQRHGLLRLRDQPRRKNAGCANR